jgi:two-component system, chemotaxis family, CheB/CheR fusion protein
MGHDAPYIVEADASRLQQVFWNLLKNAIKFTPQDGCVGVRCRLDGSGFKVRGSESEPRTLNPAPYVIVEVNDSGIGIEPEALPRIFDAFEQAQRSITRQFGGLGLGLTISKALVEMHGGKIEALSQGLDKGATFRIQLPLCAPNGQGAPSLSPAKPAAAATGKVPSLRILLAEDHGITAKMMRMVLNEEGHTVETAGDVASALQLADREHFDLLLSDLGLPDGSGHDLIRTLRQRGHKIPAIAMSGYGQEDDIRRSGEAGFATPLTKPASREQLLDAISAVMGPLAAAPGS